MADESNITRKTIEDILKDPVRINADIYKNINTMDPGLTNSLKQNKDELDGIVTSILRDRSDIGDGDYMGVFNTLYKNSHKQFLQNKKDLEDVLEESGQYSIMERLISDMSKQQLRYDDLNLLFALLPQIYETILTSRDNILSPDEFAVSVAFNRTISGQNISDFPEYETFDDRRNSILRDYKFNSIVSRAVLETLIYGKHYISIVPYKRLFAKLIDSKDDNKLVIEGYNQLFSKNKSAQESMASLIKETVGSVRYMEKETENNLSIYGLTPSDVSTENIQSMLKEYVDSIQVQEGIEYIYDFDESEYLELQEVQMATSSARNTKLYYKNKLTDILNKSKKKNDGKIEIDTATLPDINAIGADSGVMSAKDEKKIDPDSIDIKGCRVKHLDISKLIPIELEDDTILGYYYIEQDKYRNVKTRSVFDMFKINLTSRDYNGNGISDIYLQLAEIITQKLNKKFVEKNTKFKRQLYEILRYSELDKSINKITFFRADEIVKWRTEDEQSILNGVLFFAKLYLAFFINSIMLKLERGYDVRAFYVKEGIGPHNGNLTQSAIREYKGSRKSLNMVNHVSRILGVIAPGNDLFFPTNPTGEHPVDMEVLQGQDVSLKDDLLNDLQDIIINGMGMPAASVRMGEEPEFARTYSVNSSKVARRVILRQEAMNEALTLTEQKILLSEMAPDDHIYIFNSETEFMTPKMAAVQNLSEQMNVSFDFAQRRANIIAGDQGGQESEQYRQLMREMIEEDSPNFKLDKWSKRFKEIEVEVVKIKEDNPDEMGTDDQFGNQNNDQFGGDQFDQGENQFGQEPGMEEQPTEETPEEAPTEEVEEPAIPEV